MGERRKRGRHDRSDYREAGRGNEARYGRDEPWREEPRERHPNERYGGDRSARQFEGANYRRDFAPEGYAESAAPSGYGHGYGYGFGDSGDYRPDRMPRGDENQRGDHPEWRREREWQMRPDSGAWNRGRTSGGFGSEHASWQSGVSQSSDRAEGWGYGQGDMQTDRMGHGGWDTDWAANRPARGPGRWGADWSNERAPSGQNYRGRAPRDYRRSDDRLREEVCDLFTDDAALDPSDVTVKVENGEITLAGSVSSREQKRRAEELAERISGVRDVINQLRVTRGETTQEGMPNSQPQTTTRGRGGNAQQAGIAADREK